MHTDLRLWSLLSPILLPPMPTMPGTVWPNKTPCHFPNTRLPHSSLGFHILVPPLNILTTSYPAFLKKPVILPSLSTFSTLHWHHPFTWLSHIPECELTDGRDRCRDHLLSLAPSTTLARALIQFFSQSSTSVMGSVCPFPTMKWDGYKRPKWKTSCIHPFNI